MTELCKWMECSNELTGRQKEFCSDKCRMAHKRHTVLAAEAAEVIAKVEQDTKVEQPKPEQTKPEQAKSNTVESLSRVELQQAIRAYPNDQWINSPEHKELMSRLHSMTIEELEADGYWIPAWKRAA